MTTPIPTVEQLAATVTAMQADIAALKTDVARLREAAQKTERGRQWLREFRHRGDDTGPDPRAPEGRM